MIGPPGTSARRLAAAAAVALLAGFGVPPSAAKDRLDLAPASCRAQLRLFTTVATWCAACRNEIGRLRHLERSFAPDRICMFAVPVDEKDDATSLGKWMNEFDPPYSLLDTLSDARVAAVKRRVREELGEGVLPATIVTDRQGRVLATVAGSPTVSDIRRLLSQAHPD